MKLSEAGEARVRGYLFILKQSLRSFLSDAALEDALRELESHVRERIETTEEDAEEAQALERLLAEVGSPLELARAYAAEVTLDEAITTRRVGPTTRALWHLAASTMLGFFALLGLLVGYLAGAAFLVIALLKPVFPNNTGLIVRDGVPQALGIVAEVPAGAEIWGGYWLIPILIALGLAVLVLTQRAATRFLVWWRERTSAGVRKDGGARLSWG